MLQWCWSLDSPLRLSPISWGMRGVPGLASPDDLDARVFGELDRADGAVASGEGDD